MSWFSFLKICIACQLVYHIAKSCAHMLRLFMSLILKNTCNCNEGDLPLMIYIFLLQSVCDGHVNMVVRFKHRWCYDPIVTDSIFKSLIRAS